METTEAFVSELSCIVNTNDRELGFWALHEHDPAFREAVERISRELGEEILLVEKLNLRVSLTRRDGLHITTAMLKRLLYRALRDCLLQACAKSRRLHETTPGRAPRAKGPLAVSSSAPDRDVATPDEGTGDTAQRRSASRGLPPTVSGPDPAVRGTLQLVGSDQITLGRGSNESSAAIRGSVAWFPSEEALLGAFLFMLMQRKGNVWPYRTLASWGSSIEEVVRRCLARGPRFAADVLAAASELGAGPVLTCTTDSALVQSLVQTWLGAPTERSRAASGSLSLPRQVTEGLEGFAIELLAALDAAGIGTSITDRAVRARLEFGVLLELFRRWPPARGTSVPRTRLAEVVESVVHVLHVAKQEGEGIQPAGRASRAGGLVFWAMVLEESGFEQAVLEPCRPSSQVILRRALGHAFSTASLSRRDPLFLLWCGESLDATLTADFAVRDEDPERFHQRALAFAAEHRLLDGSIRIGPWGDGWIAWRGRVIVDSAFDSTDRHDAMPRVVRAVMTATGKPPTDVEVVAALEPEERDLVHEVEVMGLDDRFRPGMRVAASALRALAQDRFQAELRRTHDWRAVVVDSEHIALNRHDARQVRQGLWIREQQTLRIGGQDREVTLVS